MFAASNLLSVKELLLPTRKPSRAQQSTKNAEDYALVIFMNSYGAPFYLSNDPFAYIEQ